MAVYRKKLVDKDGNTIIPAIGDVYGPVYTASLQSASGGIATYTFTPDTPVESNRVYAVKFPEPTVNNAVILLGDGNITASSIVLPPVAASDNPSYEIAYTYNINDTEVWLLMYTGSQQWVCLNQKKPVSDSDIDWYGIVSSADNKIILGDIMIQWGMHTFPSQSFNNDWYQGHGRGSENNTFNYPTPFSQDVDTLIVFPITAPIQNVQINGTGTGTTSPKLIPITAKQLNQSKAWSAYWLAIGKK